VLFEAIIIPDDVALEKVKALEALGADVERVRPASIVDKKQASQMPVNFPSTVAYCPVFLVVCSKCTLVTSQERDLMIAPSEPSSGICTSFHGLGYPRSV